MTTTAHMQFTLFAGNFNRIQSNSVRSHCELSETASKKNSSQKWKWIAIREADSRSLGPLYVSIRRVISLSASGNKPKTKNLFFVGSNSSSDGELFVWHVMFKLKLQKTSASHLTLHFHLSVCSVDANFSSARSFRCTCFAISNGIHLPCVFVGYIKL